MNDENSWIDGYLDRPTNEGIDNGFTGAISPDWDV